MRFASPRVIAQSLASLNLAPDAGDTMNILDSVQPVMDLSSGKVLTMASASRATAGTTTIGTVPAGKVWRIYAMSLYFSDVVAGTGYAEIELKGVNTIGLAVLNTALTIPGTSLSFAGNSIELIAGETATLVTVGVNDTFVATIYYEEVRA